MQGEARILTARFAVGVLMAGCWLATSAAPTEPGAVADDAIVHAFSATSARQTWRLNRLQHYRFDISITCYCAAFGRFAVTVEDGAVVHVSPANETDIAEPTPSDLQTVDELFEVIDRLMAQRPDAVELRLDRHLGYPAFFRINPRYGIADDEWTFTIHSLTPLPTR